jgi:hypothetical protein
MSECSILSKVNSAATVTDILLFRHWQDLARKKRNEAQKQIPIIKFVKK